MRTHPLIHILAPFFFVFLLLLPTLLRAVHQDESPVTHEQASLFMSNAKDFHQLFFGDEFAKEPQNPHDALLYKTFLSQEQLYSLIDTMPPYTKKYPMCNDVMRDIFTKQTLLSTASYMQCLKNNKK